jgi:hypothetical protein
MKNSILMMVTLFFGSASAFAASAFIPDQGSFVATSECSGLAIRPGDRVQIGADPTGITISALGHSVSLRVNQEGQFGAVYSDVTGLTSDYGQKLTACDNQVSYANNDVANVGGVLVKNGFATIYDTGVVPNTDALASRGNELGSLYLMDLGPTRMVLMGGLVEGPASEDNNSAVNYCCVLTRQ